MKKSLSMLAPLAATILASTAAAAPSVVVSIKPIHSLVASIMKGVGEPGLILKGAGSPHTYQMKPAEAELLQNADLVFWVGPELEKFLEKPIVSLTDGAKVVELDKAPGLTLLATRESGMFESQDDGDEHHAGDGHDDHGERDTHVWLDTDNAKMLAKAIAASLSEVDAGNAPRYADNLRALDDRLDALATELRTTVAPVKDRPIVVFHDAYQYFEKQFGVHVAGSITVSPEALPGAARISEIHEKLKTLGAACVFAEPQFEPRLVNVVLEGTQAAAGTLDPEAATLPEGPDLYFELMRGLANSIKDCLSSQ